MLCSLIYEGLLQFSETHFCRHESMEQLSCYEKQNTFELIIFQ